MDALLGDWSIGGFEFSILEGPLLRYPAAPDGYESPLTDLGGGRFRVETGPMAGGVADFAQRRVGGVFDLEHLDRPAEAPEGAGTRAPALNASADELADFESLWGSGRHEGRRLEATDVTRFVQWLMARNEVIFHGSNRGDIEEFQPIRTSMEIGDRAGRGNRGAVYGTHDGLWSMFFAVVDRSRLTGSIRNGVGTFTNRHDGSTIDLYHFSINQESYQRHPFTTGTLYALPRADFEPIPLYPDGPPSSEWACDHPIRPLARLSIAPEDFPFLDRIAIHDDGRLLEFTRLADEIYERTLSATQLDDAFEVVTTADPDVIDEFIRLNDELLPDVSRTAIPGDAGTRIVMTGPPAFMHGIRDRLSEWLEKS